ncbi:MAG: ornithine decarboxylase [Pseudonocardiales bacterium]|nr:ornithine decarboxylase [Pseudonocardiales bacterium]
MDHSQAPVLAALADYQRRKDIPFTPPGHKQARGADKRVVEVLGAAVFCSDIVATAGLDDRRSSNRILEYAQELMADAVGAEQAFFTTCGSSLSVKAAMLSVAGPHEQLLVGRDAHKAVASGLILSGVQPIWVEPQWDSDLKLAHPPAPAAYAAAFEQHPDARGALVISPTPYGTCADLSALVRVCHNHGRPLIVDEAWGAHLPFHPDLPAWAMDAGADVCVTSVHKMGAGLEQGSVVHQQGGVVDPAVLKACVDLLGTTSPSVLIYAGLDGWRRHMVEHGHELISAALDLAQRTRAQIEDIDGLHVHGAEFTGPGRAFDRDPLQIVIDITGLGVLGYRAADWLHSNHHINLHLSDHRRICAQLSYADDTDTTRALLTALRDLAAHASDLRGGPTVDVPAPEKLRMELVQLPQNAFFGRTENVSATAAPGRVSAEILAPYPPGIPVVLPGERITQPVMDYLISGVRAGMVVDASDPQLNRIRVLVEN